MAIRSIFQGDYRSPSTVKKAPAIVEPIVESVKTVKASVPELSVNCVKAIKFLQYEYGTTFNDILEYWELHELEELGQSIVTRKDTKMHRLNKDKSNKKHRCRMSTSYKFYMDKKYANGEF